MNLRHCLDSIEAIELESASIESCGKITVARKVLLLDFKFCRSAAAVVHIVRSID
jgi:hypothetical protein